MNDTYGIEWCHVVAELHFRHGGIASTSRRNRIHGAALRFMRFQSQRDVPMSAQANGLGNQTRCMAKAPNGAALSMNAHSTNPKPRRSWNGKMNERQNEPKPKGPPRWGFVEHGRTDTQADGLGCHSVATLWRNRIDVAALSNPGRGRIASTLRWNRIHVRAESHPRCGVANYASSVPTGRSYVSPGQRPGEPNTIDCKSPNGAAITMNADATNSKSRTCSNAKMNERKNELIGQGPPRWGFPASMGTETQAVGLGCHSVATLWRNRRGIILCAEKDDVEVEYALKSKSNPIGVAAYELQSKLPGDLKGKLPSAKQLAEIVRLEMGSEQ